MMSMHLFAAAMPLLRNTESFLNRQVVVIFQILRERTSRRGRDLGIRTPAFNVMNDLSLSNPVRLAAMLAARGQHEIAGLPEQAPSIAVQLFCQSQIKSFVS
jgi:hypothetical protein